MGECGVGREAGEWMFDPVLISALDGKKISQVECGQFHTLARSRDGAVYAWGANLWGVLGTIKGKVSPAPSALLLALV